MTTPHINVLPTDQAFDLSPDAGHPLCTCSRCSAQIKEDEFPLRLCTTNDEGEVFEGSLEYRYCENCQAQQGINHAKGSAFCF